MGFIFDFGYCEKIKKVCGNFGILCEFRVIFVYKGLDEILRIKVEYEGDGIFIVFVFVVGRSNGLGLVLFGNIVYLVISCFLIILDWGVQDVWLFF